MLRNVGAHEVVLSLLEAAAAVSPRSPPAGPAGVSPAQCALAASAPLHLLRRSYRFLTAFARGDSINQVRVLGVDLKTCCYGGSWPHTPRRRLCLRLHVWLRAAQGLIARVLAPAAAHLSLDVGAERTLVAVLHDNARVAERASEDIVTACLARVVAGGVREARWLAPLHELMASNGVPNQRNQEMILKCLMSPSVCARGRALSAPRCVFGTLQ